MIGTALFDDEEDHPKRKILQEILIAKFGPLSPAALKKLASWPPAILAAQTEAVLTAKTLQELGLDEAALYRKG